MLNNPKVVIGLIILAAIIFLSNMIIPRLKSKAPSGLSESSAPLGHKTAGGGNIPGLSGAVSPDFENLNWVDNIKRDPFDEFRLLMPVATKHVVTSDQSMAPRYKLNAIIKADENRIALIDKMIVKEGERIGNDIILAIKEDHVLIDVAGQKLKLNVWEEPLW